MAEDTRRAQSATIKETPPREALLLLRFLSALRYHVMWLFNLFHHETPVPAPPESLVPLSCIVNMLARRSEEEDWFPLNTQRMSSCEFEYQTSMRLEPCETLQIKLVNGAHVLNLTAVVATVSTLNHSPQDGPAPLMAFTHLSDQDRRIVHNLIERYSSHESVSSAN